MGRVSVFGLYPKFGETILPKERSDFLFSLKGERIGRFVELRGIGLRLRGKPFLAIRTKHDSAEGLVAPILY
jgi:hypothetical protein